MESFIESPNLPNREVSLVLADGRIPDDIVQKLNVMNIKVIKTERISGVYEAVSYHPDIMLCHIGGNRVIAAPNISENTAHQLQKEGFQVIIGQTGIGEAYPKNVPYNVAIIGNFAVCNTKYTDKVLLDNLTEKKLKILDVKQGYSKCSICAAAENAVITSDNGIYKTLLKENIDVLLIRPGFIQLYNMDYGFIGGASGFISQNRLSFTGDITCHPDYVQIKNFLLKYAKKSINLSQNRLLDLGTIIPLKEYCILGT